jgi:3,4-dihydroxy 2-butanone 4-phosphate synthase/GTP cyclohydrolase II
MPFAPIDAVLTELRQGRMVVLTDDENRENEGDLILPAQFATPEAITFMLSRAMGYLCLALTEADCDRLDLHPQGPINTQVRGTAFTVTIDLHPKHGGTTGVSAKERARCIQMAIDPTFGPGDFVRPGHINPLRARDGGVLVRTGQTEGSVDLCRLAGLTPAAAIIEIMKPDGEMARVPDLERFCAEHGLLMCSVADVIDYRLKRESLVRRVDPIAGRPIRTPHGTFTALMFDSLVDPLPHLVLTVGDVGTLAPAALASETDPRPTLVRMHRRNLLGDVFDDLDSSSDGPTGGTLRASLAMLAREGRGALVYLRTNYTPDDPAAGALAHETERRLQTLRGSTGSAPAHEKDLPRAALPLAMRDFGIGGQILRNLGLSKLRLITSSHRALPGLEAFGLEIVERTPPRL